MRAPHRHHDRPNRHRSKDTRGRQAVATNWQIATPDGTYQLTTEFNLKMPEQRDGEVLLASRFMVWKLATSLVLTAVGWPGPEFKHGGEEAILSVGVSRHDRMGLVQRIRKRDPITFTSPEWLKSDQLDEAYSTLL